MSSILTSPKLSILQKQVTPGCKEVVTSAADCTALQEDLQVIYKWADKINMQFNSDKFECVRYWSDPAKAPTHNYLAPDKQHTKEKSDLRDLGVQLSNNLSFSIHIENTVTVGWGVKNIMGER